MAIDGKSRPYCGISQEAWDRIFSKIDSYSAAPSATSPTKHTPELSPEGSAGVPAFSCAACQACPESLRRYLDAEAAAEKLAEIPETGDGLGCFRGIRNAFALYIILAGLAGAIWAVVR